MADPRIQAFFEARVKLRAAAEELSAAEDALRDDGNPIPMPAKLRPARATDIVENAVLYYPNPDSLSFIQIVDEVLRPSDEFKAYTAIDGCRYGLDGAFVEDV